MPSLATHTRQRPLRRALILAGCLVGSLPLVGLAASSAQAANNYWLTGQQNSVDANPENLILMAPAPGEESAQAVYRMSNTNYDQQLTNEGYNSLAANPQNGNLGNVSQLNNQTFIFSLEYKFGEGYIYRMTNNANNNQYVTAWGTFSSPSLPTVGGSIISVNVAGTMGLPLAVPPGAGFNSLMITAQAATSSGTSPGPGNVCGQTGVYSCVRVSDLNFSAATLTQAGAASWVTTTNVNTGSNPGNKFQQLYSDVDLSTISWTLSGKVLAYKASTGGDESVKLIINTRNVTFGTPAPSQPVPGPLPLLGATMALGWSRRLRHRMARAQSVAHQR